jgi:hypothetical protein
LHIDPFHRVTAYLQIERNDESFSSKYEPNPMRNAIRALGATVVLGAIAIASAAALAQTQDPNEIAHTNFVRFLNTHPNVAADLTKNPGLVNDPKYLSNHPGLQGFLRTHPRVQKDVQLGPGTYTYANGQADWKRAPLTKEQTHNYLLDHLDVASQLEANPSLAQDPTYLAKHQGLKEFLDEHPNALAEMKEHPYGFVSQRRKGYLPPPEPPSQ